MTYKSTHKSNATRLTVAGIALLSGISLAAAADSGMAKTNGMAKDTMSKSSMSKSSSMAKDTLALTSKQKKDVWQDISKIGIKDQTPAGFTAKVGAAVPSAISTHPVPVSTANKVPALRLYQYALLDNNKLLIVNPDDKKVAQVITR
jgi:pentapeptide MXKDX repeat protein